MGSILNTEGHENIAETLSFALTEETAVLLRKPVYQIHRFDAEETTSLEETMRRIIREFFPYLTRPSTSEIKCYNCSKAGHISYCWRIPRSQPRTTLSKRKQQTLEKNLLEDHKEKQQGKADSLHRWVGHFECKDCIKVERRERIVNIRSMHLEPDEWEKSVE